MGKWPLNCKKIIAFDTAFKEAFFFCPQYCDVKSMHDSPLVEENLDEWIENLDDLGIVEKSNNTALIIYSKMAARLKSFEKCNMNLKPDTLTLCEAGFFYAGLDDNTICFYCLKSIQNWEYGDDPWKEHAIWSPLCSHVLLCKGIQFVEEACGVKSGGLKAYQERMKCVNGILDSHVSDDEMDRNHGLPESPRSFTAANPRFVIPEHSEQTNSFRCKICLDLKMNVVFIPCCHIFACFQCADLLDRCSICRLPKYSYELVKIEIEERNNVGNVASTSSEQCSVELTDSTLCTVCHEKEIRAALVPCMHVYACLRCAQNNSTCKVCSKTILSILPVYL